MDSANDIRATFLDFFARNDHQVVPSSPLVPRNDPSLLFTNSGMVQFKNTFTGAETREYKRAVSAQKCVRAGGKHNDLENVGYTARHHTFFEMLGNFSFGDYFKDRAIELAWDLLTKEYGLDPKRLLVTVYGDDDEAFTLWKKITSLPEARIIRISTSDNFWSMGETGPCGPCSEIFFDHGDKIPGGPPGSPDQDGDRFVEIWNLVFMQYEQVSPDRRIDLPKPSVDTGLGLERMAAVAQGSHDNYDVDLLRHLILASAEATGREPDGEQAVSHRVIADHLRASSFLIADGVMPSNEGRGYVLRRIMRRAMRHAHLLGAKEPLMWRLVPALVRLMGQAYPEIVRAEPLITETLKLEEGRFQITLARGLRLLEDETEKMSAGGELPGEVAFKLYDTFGFPLDLTQDVLRGQGRTVELAGFDKMMERQRAEARKAWAGSGEVADERIWFEIRERVGASEFLGYQTETAEGRVEALVVDGEPAEAADQGAEVALVLNQTPAYGESGGQVGDRGVMLGAGGATLAFTQTLKKAEYLHVHLGSVEKGRLAVGDVVEVRVDAARRRRVRANHSVTHLLHEALRRRLGDHVTQKGSLVADDRMRFDFSHPKALTPEDLREIQAEVNARIRANDEVVTRLMTPDEAIEQGALALFGEKYGEEVRVVSMGAEAGRYYSTELCGGTHVRRTGDIGFCAIVSEGAVAAGVRRIEVLTGAAAIDHVAARDQVLAAAAAALKSAPADLADRVTTLLEDRKRLERELSEARRALAKGGGDTEAEIKDIAGIKFAPRKLDGVPAKELRSMADEIKKQIKSGVVAIVATHEGKVANVVAVTDDLTDRFDSVALVKIGVAELGGTGGGGRPDMAQGGGPDASQADAALAAIEKALKLQAASA